MPVNLCKRTRLAQFAYSMYPSLFYKMGIFIVGYNIAKQFIIFCDMLFRVIKKVIPKSRLTWRWRGEICDNNRLLFVYVHCTTIIYTYIPMNIFMTIVDFDLWIQRILQQTAKHRRQQVTMLSNTIIHNFWLHHHYHYSHSLYCIHLNFPLQYNDNFYVKYSH